MYSRVPERCVNARALTGGLRTWPYEEIPEAEDVLVVNESKKVSLTSKWFMRPGCEAAATTAIRELASAVAANEPDTLAYLVHFPWAGPGGLETLPPPQPGTVVFFETYRNVDAFHAHVNGPVFTNFVARHGELFVAANGKPFIFVEFLAQGAGFAREASGEPRFQGEAANAHPAVMFEIIAKDQTRLKDFYQKVFGWSYQTGNSGFAFVKFPTLPLPLLGGIGQADPAQPGYAQGHNFYLLVDDLKQTIRSAEAAGGRAYVEPTVVDGYEFAMLRDPENNPIGLIRPFSQ
jgi:predicted enzyme related to lactoylglutathione lyase/quinol monooxygenase YgiN